MAWTDNGMDWSVDRTGYITDLHLYLEAIRQATMERAAAVGLTPGILGTAWTNLTWQTLAAGSARINLVLRGIEAVIDEIFDESEAFPQPVTGIHFVDPNDEVNWDQTAAPWDGPPKYTEADLLADIDPSETRLRLPSGGPFLVRWDWIQQQYEILRRMTMTSKEIGRLRDIQQSHDRRRIDNSADPATDWAAEAWSSLNLRNTQAWHTELSGGNSSHARERSVYEIQTKAPYTATGVGGDTRDWKLYAYLEGVGYWNAIGTSYAQDTWNILASGTETGTNDEHDEEANYDDTLPLATPTPPSDGIAYGWATVRNWAAYITADYAVSGGFEYQGS